MDGDNPAIFDKKPENPGIEFAHMTQLKEPATEGLGQRLPVILAIAQFRQPRENCGEIIRIAGLQLLQKFPHGTGPSRCLIEFYTEVPNSSTPILM
jgi:hypothetical protein